MLTLRPRSGPRPTTNPGLPHAQLDQQPTDDQLRMALAERIVRLTGVREGPSGVSVPGARALILDPAFSVGPLEAFMIGREFAHLHPGADHSLHLCLPVPLAEEACRAGWAEPHPLAADGRLPESIVLVYAPRDEAELHVVSDLVEESYRFATGQNHRGEPNAIHNHDTRGGHSSMSITAFRHIGLTVTDLDRSARWYIDLLGFQELFRESSPERSAVILGIPGTDVVLGLVQFLESASDSFSPRRTGLDHLCFAVSSRKELESWATRLEDRGVAHSGVIEMTTSPIINFKDPDGIALAIALSPRLPR